MHYALLCRLNPLQHSLVFSLTFTTFVGNYGFSPYIFRLNFGTEVDSACFILLEHLESGSTEKSSKVVTAAPYSYIVFFASHRRSIHLFNVSIFYYYDMIAQTAGGKHLPVYTCTYMDG